MTIKKSPLIINNNDIHYLYVDGSGLTKENDRCIGVGGVIFNKEKKEVLSFTESIDLKLSDTYNFNDKDNFEAIAIIRGIQIALKYGITKLFIKTDSEQLVGLVNKAYQERKNIKVYEMLNPKNKNAINKLIFMVDQLSFLNIVYINRKKNKIADFYSKKEKIEKFQKYLNKKIKNKK